MFAGNARGLLAIEIDRTVSGVVRDGPKYSDRRTTTGRQTHSIEPNSRRLAKSQ